MSRTQERVWMWWWYLVSPTTNPLNLFFWLPASAGMNYVVWADGRLQIQRLYFLINLIHSDALITKLYVLGRYVAHWENLIRGWILFKTSRKSFKNLCAKIYFTSCYIPIATELRSSWQLIFIWLWLGQVSNSFTISIQFLQTIVNWVQCSIIKL